MANYMVIVQLISFDLPFNHLRLMNVTVYGKLKIFGGKQFIGYFFFLCGFSE